jgi:hypothetical protein
MVKLNVQYAAVASSLLDEYVAKKRDQRAAVVANEVQQITTLAEKEGLLVPPFLHKVPNSFSAPFPLAQEQCRHLRFGSKTIILR